MNEPLHDIDKLFHDSIEGHSEYPGKKVWDKIESGLDKDTVTVYKKKYRIVKRAAAILLILFLGIVIYEITNRDKSDGNVAGGGEKDQEHKQANKNHESKMQNENIKSPVEKDGTEAINEAPDKDQQSANEKYNDINERGKDVKLEQPKVNSTSVVTNDDEVVANKESKNKKEFNNKKTSNDNVERNETVVIDVRTPGKTKRNNLIDDTASEITNTVNNNNGVRIIGRPSRPYDRVVNGSLMNNAQTIFQSTADISPNGSASILGQLNFSKPKRSANKLLSNRGLSLQAYFLPATAWNEIEDDKPHQPGGGGGPGGPPVQDHQEIKKNESKSIAYSGGIKLNYGFGKRISVQAGLNYTKSSTSGNSKKIYAERDNNGHVRYRIDCSSGYTYLLPKGSSNPATGDTKTVSDTKNTVAYAGIPFGIEYRLLSGKFSLSLSGGGQANLLLKGKTTTVFDKGTNQEGSVSGTTEGLKSSYFSALAGINGELRLNEKLSLNIIPTGQFALTPINSGASVKTKPNYFGLSAGVRLKL